MSDPVAQAAAQIAADAAPSSTEPTGIIGEIVNEFHKLEEKVEHFIHPGSAEVAGETAAAHVEAAPVDTSATTSASAAVSVETQAAGESPNAAAIPPDGAATDAGAGDEGKGGAAGAQQEDAAVAEQSEQLTDGSATDASGSGQPTSAEHPHTTILRNLTTTLRRKFNVFDSEMETLLKDAESHL